MMTQLSEVLQVVEDLDGELTIYASTPWTRDSNAYVGVEPEATDPARPPDVEYLLDVFLAKEVIEVWSQWRDGMEPTPGDRCEAVIYYAMNDAYMPTE